jgi:hypothetical protein
MTLSKPMIIFALRYCLQSASYAPLTCTRYLLNHWTEFDSGLQVQMVDEIRSRLAMQTMPTDIAPTWEDMLNDVAQRNGPISSPNP